MKTRAQVQRECVGEVYTLKEFRSLYKEGLITLYDGYGYFHDGEAETDVDVFSDVDPEHVWESYRYVCWYNR